MLYRITAFFKIETDIVTNITASPIGQAAILVIKYVKTYKTDIIVFIGNVILLLT